LQLAFNSLPNSLFLQKSIGLKRFAFFFLLSFSLPFVSLGQDNPCRLEFSLLTCTPGEELYSSFGHSAIRLKNFENGSDIVFNYGTFDFDDPDFYMKFVRGKLLYFVSIDSFNDFMFEYEYFKRGVTEQVLNLTCEEKTKLLYALYENAREENKYYKYDFTYDNCTTRLRDIVRKEADDSMRTKDILNGKRKTFRDLIHVYLDRGGQYWSKLGIDILLGARLDKPMTNNEAMFLPDYLMKAMDSSSLGDRSLVSDKKILLTHTAPAESSVFVKPFWIFTLLFLLVAAAGLSKNKRVRRALRIFDIVFFFLTGLTGCLLVFMWTGTDHYMCKNNYNLLWAVPSHFIMALLIPSSRKWVSNYFRVVAVVSLVLLIVWFLLPQQLNTALIPLTAISGIRSFLISKQNR